MPGDPLLIQVPVEGRRFVARRTVRLADASPAGRLRLDAVARYLQDVADDDANDAGLSRAGSWVVRRTTIQIGHPPVFREAVELVTFCSGVGGRWAERRTSVRGERGGRVEAVALWVHVDVASGRPTRLPALFDEVYGSAHGGRHVTPRLVHGEPVDSGTQGAVASDFPLRFADFDVVGHVNNAVYWAAVEDVLARRRDLRGPLRAEVEHRTALGRNAQATLQVREGPNGFEMWVLDGPPGQTAVSASARLERAEESASTA
jgi:acyl-ACP thioesterase